MSNTRKNLTFAKRIAQIALLGTVLGGTIFGFHFKGETLDLFRATSAILLILIAVIFFPNFLRKDD